MVILSRVELPYNQCYNVSRDAGNFFEHLAVLAHADDMHYYQNYWKAWQQ